MTKKMRNLIIGTVCVVVLVGVVILVSILFKNDGNGESSSSSAVPTINLVKKTQDEVAKISVTNSIGSYVIERTGSKAWKISELDGLPLLQSPYESITTDASVIDMVSKVSDNETNLAQYGLDKPSATVEITYADKSVFSFDLGNKTPKDDGYYFKQKDKNTVYIIDQYKTTYYLGGKEMYLDTSILPSPLTEEKTTVEIKKIVLGGTVRSKEIVAVKRTTEVQYNSSLVITSPQAFDFDMNIEGEFSQKVFGVTASEVIKIRPNAQELATYGLDKPYSTMYLEYDALNVTLKLGKLESGNYYLMKNDVPVVYLVSEDSVYWAKKMFFDLISKTVVLRDINSVSEVIVATTDKTYTSVITNDKENTAVSAKVNGKAVTMDYFKNYYQILLSGSYVGENTVKPADKPTLTITFKLRDGKSSVIQFFSSSERRHFTVIDGQKFFDINTSYIDKLISDSEKIANNKDVNTTV